MKTSYDAIIIGAGPAGATAATLLTQAGWSVALVEKQVFPRRKVCGECIAAPNLALIVALGLEQAFNVLAGAPLRRVGLFSGEHMSYADLPAFGDGSYRWGKALGREYLDQLLLQRAVAAGASVWQPYTVRQLNGGPGRFSCEIAGDTGAAVTLTAPLAIAANGSWEPAPYTTARLPKKPGDLFGFKANYRNSGIAPGTLPVLAFRGGYGGMVVGDHETATLACCIRRDVLADCRQRYGTHTAAQAVEAYLQASCRGVAEALAGAEQQDSWLSVGPIRPGIRIGGAGHPLQPLLIGNAAGEAHPIIGEGISMAMQSASLLSQRLLAHHPHSLTAESYRHLSQAYADDWHRSFAARIRLSALFAHVAMRPALTNRLLPMLQRWPGLLTHGARFSGKVRSAVMQ